MLVALVLALPVYFFVEFIALNSLLFLAPDKLLPLISLKLLPLANP